VAQFAAVDVDIADPVALELVALVAGLFLRAVFDPMESLRIPKSLEI